MAPTFILFHTRTWRKTQYQAMGEVPIPHSIHAPRPQCPVFYHASILFEKEETDLNDIRVGLTSNDWWLYKRSRTKMLLRGKSPCFKFPKSWVPYIALLKGIKTDPR